MELELSVWNKKTEFKKKKNKRRKESSKNKLSVLLSAKWAVLVKMLVALICLTMSKFKETVLKESLLDWASQWICMNTHNSLVRHESWSLERQNKELNSKSVVSYEAQR